MLGIRTSRARTAVILLLLGVPAILGALGPGAVHASSHREAPLIANDPQADNTDLYAFVSPNQPDTVTLIANWIPFEDPNGGPNFYPFAPGAHYDIDVDNDGDGKADITYRWTFKNVDHRGANTFLYNNGPVTSLDDENLLFKQTYTLKEIQGASSKTIATGTAAPSNLGAASMPDYASLRTQAIDTVVGGGKTYAGQADDPFFLDLRVFDLLYGANLKEAGHDTLSGYNVNTIALQVPASDLVLNGDATRNPVIGVWSTTERQTVELSPGKATPKGAFVQVSRLGNPLVNEVVVPAVLKDAFNAITPDVDHTVTPVVERVKDPEVPQLIQAIYHIPAPAAPRNDLVEIFLTGICKACGPIQADLNSQMLNKDVSPSAFVPAEELRLNVSVPSTAQPKRLGVLAGDLQGFPNGRRLTDDVVDIALQSMEGAAQTGKLVAALAAGDGVNANDVAFGDTFPYVALPHTAAVNETSRSAAAPNGTGPTVATASSKSSWVVPLVAAILGAIVLAAASVVVLGRRRSGRPGPAGGQS
jgi:Domain of unknown function (DUF4331)